MAKDGWEFWKVTTAGGELAWLALTRPGARAVIDRQKVWTLVPKLRVFIANWFVTEDFVRQDGRFTTRLGIKVGVLTDNTVTETMQDRSNRKRSSEEIKLVRLIQRFEDNGLPAPDFFGVPEDDLLFAFPPDAIAEYLQGPFPGWHELRDECRVAEGLGPSDSVDWKSHAKTQYGLDLTTVTGVRAIVRALDLAGVELPSIKAAVEKVIAWAN